MNKKHKEKHEHINIVRDLLLKIGISSGREEIDYSDYTDSISATIGGHYIIADPYYQRIIIDDDVIENGTEDFFNLLEKELETRLTKFNNKIDDVRKQISLEVFDKPITKTTLDKLLGEK